MTLTLFDGEHVTSVQQFVSTVLKPPVRGIQPFYRGVSRHYEYERTLPSVFRSQAKRDHEKVLFDQLLAMNPADFSNDSTTLDKLVRMQHHSLPTRLLDITSNPLMALFFACEGNPKREGEVLVFGVQDVDVKFPDSDRASVMANLARLTPSQHAAIDTTLSREEFNESEPIKKLIHFIRQEKPYFEARINRRHVRSIMVIRGKQSNVRIRAQAGAFLLFGDGAQFSGSSKGEGILERVIKVQAEAKAKIYRELDQLNINESTVYPSLERSAAYISKRYS